MNIKTFFDLSCNDDKEFRVFNIQADKLMLSLFVLQWFIATFVSSVAYNTHWYGFFTGAFIVSSTFLIYRYYKGTRIMMTASGMFMMLFSLIFIQQYYGRIEIHFHIFIGMAVLTVYKHALPILVAAITTTAHHFVFNYLQLHGISLFGSPIIVFNYGCGLDIVFLHALFVVIEAIVLVYIAKIQIGRTKELILAKRKLNELNQQLEHTSGHDTLTGLLNRFNLNRQAEYIIANAHRNKSRFAVIFLDLDHFKNVNDTLGHDVGDELLKEVALKLTSIVRENDVVSRIGGDEFIIILVDVVDVAKVAQIAEKILNVFREELHVQEHKLRISSSVGVSLYPDDSTSFAELTKYADTAMYNAKKLGRDNFHFFTKVLDDRLHLEVDLIQDMQRALDDKEFKLYYQPKVNVKSGKITGAEALLRWEHKTKGIISPNEFIPLAEKTGFILKLGKFVIDDSSEYIARLNSLGYKDIKVSVNVSVRQFNNTYLVKDLEDALFNNTINSKQLAIEITESIMLENLEPTIEKLKQIQALGIEIHMDDFGTGYSSLSYLKDIPIDVLKIDKIFIDEISENGKNDKLILNTILAMGQTLGLSVVAEGIEYKYQLEHLQVKHCEDYQGFYFSKAVKEDEFIGLLNQES